MKKLMLAALPAALLALTIACDNGSNVTDCTVDADCADLVDTPICDETLLICVADGGVDECAEDLDCQIIDGSEGAGCTSTNDCPDGATGDEACVEGFDGEGFCLVTGDADVCDLEPGFVSESLPEVGGGGNVNVCVSDEGTCGDGACTFP